MTTTKCSRCNTYFNESTGATCSFHNAPWVDVHVPGKGSERIGVWSCCKEVTRSAPGCQQAYHTEDLETTEILRKFEIFAVKGTRADALELLDTEFIKKNLGGPPTRVRVMNSKTTISTVNSSTTINTTTDEYSDGQVKTLHTIGYSSKPNPLRPPLRVPMNRKKDDPAPEGYIKYDIKLTDTLQGIALRHNTTVAELKQLNKLFSNSDLFKLNNLLIRDVNYVAPAPVSRPLHPAAPYDSYTHAWHVTKFAMGAGVCPEEALFYLSDNGWDPVLAQSSRESDVVWAEAQLLKQKGKLTELLGDKDVQTVAVVALGCIVVLLCIVL